MGPVNLDDPTCGIHPVSSLRYNAFQGVGTIFGPVSRLLTMNHISGSGLDYGNRVVSLSFTLLFFIVSVSIIKFY